jgi:hypothetical protein
VAWSRELEGMNFILPVMRLNKYLLKMKKPRQQKAEAATWKTIESKRNSPTRPLQRATTRHPHRPGAKTHD